MLRKHYKEVDYGEAIKINKKSVKMKVVELKSELNKLTQQEVIELMVESYKISDEVQGFISVKLKGDRGVLEILSEYKQRIKNEFFPTRGCGKLKVAEVKKVISDFNKIIKETESVFEIMLFFVEIAAAFIHEHGDISEEMGDYLCEVFESVVIRLNKEKTEGLFMKYKERLEAIVNTKGIECWGIHDSLEGSYLDIKWIDDEDEDEEDSPEIISYAAMKMWLEIPELTRNKIIDNVWCGKCLNAAAIRDYTVHAESFGILLKGNCMTCGHQVARLVEKG